MGASASRAGPTRVHQSRGTHTTWYVSEQGGLLTASRYIHRYNSHWCSLSCCLLLRSAVSPGNDHLEWKRKPINKGNLLRCSEPRIERTLHRDHRHPCCFKDRGKWHTLSTFPVSLIRLVGIYNSLSFTENLVNLFFDHLWICRVGGSLRLLHESPLNHNRIFFSWIESLVTSLNHVQALRFWRLPMTSTLTNDGYKPQPSLLGGEDVVLTSVIVHDFSKPSLCPWGHIGRKSKALPISHVTMWDSIMPASLSNASGEGNDSTCLKLGHFKD